MSGCVAFCKINPVCIRLSPFCQKSFSHSGNFYSVISLILSFIPCSCFPIWNASSLNLFIAHFLSFPSPFVALSGPLIQFSAWLLRFAIPLLDVRTRKIGTARSINYYFYFLIAPPCDYSLHLSSDSPRPHSFVLPSWELPVQLACLPRIPEPVKHVLGFPVTEVPPHQHTPAPEALLAVENRGGPAGTAQRLSVDLRTRRPWFSSHAIVPDSPATHAFRIPLSLLFSSSGCSLRSKPIPETLSHCDSPV